MEEELTPSQLNVILLDNIASNLEDIKHFDMSNQCREFLDEEIRAIKLVVNDLLKDI